MYEKYGGLSFEQTVSQLGGRIEKHKKVKLIAQNIESDVMNKFEVLLAESILNFELKSQQKYLSERLSHVANPITQV